MFLIRTAFWLSLLILILPTDEQKQQAVYGNAEAAVQDLRGFFKWNSVLFEASKSSIYTFSQKAKCGAIMLTDFVYKKTGDANYQPVSQSGNRRPSFFRRDTQSTLTAEDMQPAWSIPSDNGSGV